MPSSTDKSYPRSVPATSDDRPPTTVGPATVEVATVEVVAPPPLRSWLPGLVVLGALWGASFLFIKVAVVDLHPLWVAAGRLVFGGLILGVILLVQRRGLPTDPRAWLVNGLIGVVGCALPFSLFAFAGERIPSLLSGLWNSTTPLVVLPLAVLVFRTEPFTVRRLVGLLLGLTGSLVILGVWDLAGGQYDLAGQLMCLGASACYGISIAFTRRFVSSRHEPPVVAATVQMVVGAVVQVPVALVVAGLPLPGVAALAAVVALGALGTGIGFLINLSNIARLGASAASSVTYLVPVFATILGVVVLQERLTWHQVVGGVIVLVGVAVAQGAFRRRTVRRSATGTRTAGSGS